MALSVRRALCIGCIISGISSAAPSAAWAQDQSKDLEQNLDKIKSQIEDSKTKASKLSEEVEVFTEAETNLQEQLVGTANRAQSLEERLSVLERRLTTSRAQETRAQDALNIRSEELRSTIAGLTRMGRRPPQALLMAPGDTHDAIRAAIMLGSSVPVLQARAARLKQTLNELTEIQNSIEFDLVSLEDTKSSLAEEQTVLAHLKELAAARRQYAENERRKQSRTIANLAQKAEGLKDLLKSLSEMKIPDVRPIPRPKDNTALKTDVPPQKMPAPLPQLREGGLSLPAAGRIASRFGEKDAEGVDLQGIKIETRSGAIITAPAGGRIAFADIFNNYGLLLIIEHADGYHTLLSGMSILDVDVNQRIVAGEPLGRMSSDKQQTNLYVELRANGTPINPLPWFAALNKKVNG